MLYHCDEITDCQLSEQHTTSSADELMKYIRHVISLFRSAADGDVRSRSTTALGPLGGATVGKHQNKKLVGIRYLFPAFDERTTLLDRARVWVARHDYKYFVDWTEDQLKAVDPALRPYAPITREIYKLHMNRQVYLCVY
jgi:hypothetical protein